MTGISDIDIWSRRVADDPAIECVELDDASRMIRAQLATIEREGQPVPIDLLYALRIVETARERRIAHASG